MRFIDKNQVNTYNAIAENEIKPLNFQIYISDKFDSRMIRSYDPEYTRSRPITEVKLGSAPPVLRSEMTREAGVTNRFAGKTFFTFT
jgi:hypothetical protein